MRLGPQYPHPTTPTLIWSFILSRERPLAPQLGSLTLPQFAHLRNESRNRFCHDLHVQQQRLGPRVSDVPTDHLVEGRPVLAVDLPQARQPRQRVESLPLPGKIIFTFIRDA